MSGDRDRSITGSISNRRYAGDIADWCERELNKARQTGHIETRPFVQNAGLIIIALREYAKVGAPLAATDQSTRSSEGDFKPQGPRTEQN